MRNALRSIRLDLGNRMDAPCCDVFELENGKIKRFDRYPSGTVILAQPGVLGTLAAALRTGG